MMTGWDEDSDEVGWDVHSPNRNGVGTGSSSTCQFVLESAGGLGVQHVEQAVT